MTIADLPADVLRHLAAIAETRERDRAPAGQLRPEALDELVAILEAGQRPSYAWWAARLPAGGWWQSPALPPLPEPRVRSWEPWELVTAGIDMAAEGVEADVAHHVLHQLACRHRLGTRHFAEAVAAYHDR